MIWMIEMITLIFKRNTKTSYVQTSWCKNTPKYEVPQKKSNESPPHTEKLDPQN